MVAEVPPADGLAIAAVERDTGLSKDTLRIWERRYGFPQPARGTLGERSYPPEQVEKLRLLKRLMDSGHRPGKLVALDLAALQRLGQRTLGAVTARASALDPAVSDLLRRHDVLGLRRSLQQALLSLGLERFVTEHVGPLNVAVGEAWMRGELSVPQEHVYTEALQHVLRQAIGSVAEPAAGAPRVLLATLPQEAHGLGLLMAEALLSLNGCHCTALGVKVPLDGIVAAAELTRADIVALSFSGSFNVAQAMAGLEEMRRLLPAATGLWAGGTNPSLQRKLPEHVQPVADIALLAGLLKDWRSQHRHGDR